MKPPSSRRLRRRPGLFTEQGFHETTVDQIAAEAGVSRRTFFRYYDAKSEVLWAEFDKEVATILGNAPGDVPVLEAVRSSVIAANHYRAEDVPELRMRMPTPTSPTIWTRPCALWWSASVTTF